MVQYWKQFSSSQGLDKSTRPRYDGFTERETKGAKTMGQSYNVRYAAMKHQQRNTDTLAKLHSRLADLQADKRAKAEHPMPTDEEIQTLISEGRVSELHEWCNKLRQLRTEYYPVFFNLGLQELMRLENVDPKSIKGLR